MTFPLSAQKELGLFLIGIAEFAIAKSKKPLCQCNWHQWPFELATKKNLDYSWSGLQSLKSTLIIIAIAKSKKLLYQCNLHQWPFQLVTMNLDYSWSGLQSLLTADSKKRLCKWKVYWILFQFAKSWIFTK